MGTMGMPHPFPSLSRFIWLRKIGVRMALGARTFDVLCLVILRGLRLGLWGLLIGLGAALVVTCALASLLFAVMPADPLTLAGVSLLVATVALLASYIPARRAARLELISWWRSVRVGCAYALMCAISDSAHKVVGDEMFCPDRKQ